MKRLQQLTLAVTTLVLLVTLASRDSIRAEQVAPPTPKPQTIEELQKALQAILTRNNVPGAGIALVAKDRIIWAGGVGKADLSANRPVAADTVFRVGSISKSFVALALLKLQEEGKIDLNARVEDIAPEIRIPNPWASTHPVRVVNLLEHTAGFDDMHPNEVYNTQDPPDIPLREVFQRFPKPQEVRWPPGTRMSYANPGYGLAGYLIERVSGQPFEDYIQNAILAALGMKLSSFRLTAANRALLAQGYNGTPPRIAPYKNIYLRPAGDLKSSPAEMGRFVQMMLNRGRLDDAQLVRPESLQRMETPETTLAARAGLKNGYGFGDYASLNHPLKEYGHDGGIDGFISTYRYMPGQGVGYVVLLNSTVSGKALGEMNDLAFNYLTRGLPTPPQQPAAKLTAAELNNFGGYYEPASPRNQMFAFLDLLLNGRNILVDNGKLYEKGLLGKREPLIPVSPTEARYEKEPEASGIFCTAEDGTKVFTGSGFYRVRVNPWWPQTRLGLILASLALMLSSLLFALIWGPRRLFGRMKGVKHLYVRALPLLAVLALVASVVFFFRILGSGNPGVQNFDTEAFCVATWCFAGLSLVSLVTSLKALGLEIHKGVRIHSLLVALACCGLAAYLSYWHIIGLKLWAY